MRAELECAAQTEPRSDSRFAAPQKEFACPSPTEESGVYEAPSHLKRACIYFIAKVKPSGA